MEETNTWCAAGSAATLRRTHDGCRATSTTASGVPSAGSASARSSSTSRAPSGTDPERPRQRTGHSVPAVERLLRHRAGEEQGAAEHEQVHACTVPRPGPLRNGSAP